VLSGPVAVVGAGTIGRSWIEVFVRAGLEVRVHDPLVAIGDDRVRACDSLAGAVAGAVWIQESVPEDRALKRTAFAELDRLAPADAILGSSASAIAMTEIATGLERPERCVVVHPTNPPHLVPLVEIVPGELTSEATVERAVSFMRELGQEPIVCRKEIFGFVLNRLQFALVREALFLLREGVASVGDIDRCVTSGLALRWAFLGPFAVEESNAASIEDDLRKFREPIRELFARLCSTLDGPTEDDIELASAGCAAMLDGISHDRLTAYRDEMIVRLRELKAAHPLGAAA